MDSQAVNAYVNLWQLRSRILVGVLEEKQISPLPILSKEERSARVF